MSELYSDSIFWIETSKINPNPYQPRKEFNEESLQDLADSVRQYGVLQPLVVTRVEHAKDDGGMSVEYELIAGERRLRASKIAGLQQVPVIIRRGENSKMKLELAIIENLQREDLNPIDRARAFARLVDEFGLTHGQIGKKMGKSRAYVSNSLRLLQLPQDIMEALQGGRISEGHTRPLMMLSDRPMEQSTLFKEIMYKKMSVRESEKIARGIATDKARKPVKTPNPRMKNYQDQLSERLGTRVAIEEKEVGGKIVIDFFSADDVESILKKIHEERAQESMLDKYIAHKNESDDNGQEQLAQSNGLIMNQRESSHDEGSHNSQDQQMPTETGGEVSRQSETLHEIPSEDQNTVDNAFEQTAQQDHMSMQTDKGADVSSLNDSSHENTDVPQNEETGSNPFDQAQQDNHKQDSSNFTATPAPWDTQGEPESSFEEQKESVPEDTEDDLYGLHNFE